MSNNVMLIAAGYVASVLLIASCGTNSGPLAGKYAPGSKADAEIVLYLKADGTLLRAEGLRGGIFEKESEISGEPHGLGKKVADISIWDHDGSLEDLKIEDGTTDGKSAHLHSGLVNPPWNSHCHKWIKIGGTWLLDHCP